MLGAELFDDADAGGVAIAEEAGTPPCATRASVRSAGKAGLASGKVPQGSGRGRPAISQWPEGVSFPAAVSTPWP